MKEAASPAGHNAPAARHVMEAAFPTEVRHHLPAVRAHLEQTDLMPSGLITQTTITVGGESLRIPSRQYDRPVNSDERDPQARVLWLAWFTRSHDGWVRQRAVRGLFGHPAPWIVPYVTQLLGEYVIEICDDIAAFLPDAVQDPDWADALRSFWVDNPGFIGLTRARAVSYWNEYYRRRIPNFADYPAARALDALDQLARQPTIADRESLVIEPPRTVHRRQRSREGDHRGRAPGATYRPGPTDAEDFGS